MKQLKFTPESFLSIAKDIMLKHKLRLNKDNKTEYYKICDIEFYLYTRDHPDPYALCFDNDRTYILFGIDDENNKHYISILIRGLVNSNRELIEGDKCNELLNLYNGGIIRDIYDNINIKLEVDNKYEKKIIKSGMRLIKGYEDEYINKNYRYSTEWSKTKRKLIVYRERKLEEKSDEYVEPIGDMDSEERELLRNIWILNRKIKNATTEREIKYYKDKLERMRKS